MGRWLKNPAHRVARACDCGDHGFVRLTRWGTALMSPEDIPLIAENLWTCNHKGYAKRTDYVDCQKCDVTMHALIAGPGHDHANRDRLDNRRGNLRPASRSQNMANRRAWGGVTFKGVSLISREGKYRARVQIGGKCRLLGEFSCPIEAARAYDRAAIAAYGDFAATNAALGLLPSEAA